MTPAQAALRSTDVLARWGGEEFMLLMPDTPITAARLSVERLRTRLHDFMIRRADQPTLIDISFVDDGGAELPPADACVTDKDDAGHSGCGAYASADCEAATGASG